MDATAGVTATQKALDTLKSMPMWLLVGLCIVILSIWLWPPFFALVPESLRSAVPVALTAAAVLLVCNFVGASASRLFERRRQTLAHDRKRLLKLYRPLVALFLTRHVTVCTSRGAPYLRLRLQNARRELGSYQRRSVGLKRAWRALFDQQISSSAEVEFGGDFPLSQIVELVKKEAEHADTELLSYVRRADRSRYEDASCPSMTDEEFELFEHISNEHDRLRARTQWTTSLDGG